MAKNKNSLTPVEGEPKKAPAGFNNLLAESAQKGLSADPLDKQNFTEVGSR